MGHIYGVHDLYIMLSATLFTASYNDKVSKPAYLVFTKFLGTLSIIGYITYNIYFTSNLWNCICYQKNIENNKNETANPKMNI